MSYDDMMLSDLFGIVKHRQITGEAESTTYRVFGIEAAEQSL